jgi:hypothetical protein
MTTAAAPQPRRERADSRNLELMRKMHAKGGYDPMPTDQHQWQRAKGEPMVNRIWAALCWYTVHIQPKPAHVPIVGFATLDDGVTPLMFPDLVKSLDEDQGNVRRGWIDGQQKGLWHRDDQGRLWLHGDVTAAKVAEANKQRKEVCTRDFTPRDLLKIKTLPKERQEELFRVWEAEDAYYHAEHAELKAKNDAKHSGIKDNIRAEFGLEVRRLAKKPRPPLEVPECLLHFVQTGSDTPVPTDAKNGFVQTSASLFPSEENTEVEGQSVGQVSPIPEEADRPTPPAPKPNGHDPDEPAAPETPSSDVPNLQQNAAGPASPEDPELAAVAGVIHAELGRACPGQYASEKLCREVRAALGETPLDYFALALRARVERAIRRREPTSLGLALPLARETAARWRVLPEKEKRAWLARGRAPLELEPHKPTAEDVEAAREILASPASDQSQKQFAREFLEANADLAAQIAKAAAAKKL